MSTRAENIERLQAKASELLTWFEAKELPVGEFVIKQGETCLNAERMVLVILEVMHTYADNPFSKPFVAAYLRLNNLKIYIDRANVKPIGGRSKKLPKSSVVGN